MIIFSKMLVFLRSDICLYELHEAQSRHTPVSFVTMNGQLEFESHCRYFLVICAGIRTIL